MRVEKTTLPGVVIITPRRFADDRGFFSECWNSRAMAEAGLHRDWVQDNHSLSQPANTLRGLHFQTPPFAQAKLVRCGQGEVFDIAVDLRCGSPTFGQWFGALLSAENGAQLFIPEGFAHGFITRVPQCEVLYKCSAPYDGPSDRAIRWDDPTLAIDWGNTLPPLLSEKDATAPRLSDIISPFSWEAAE